MTEPAGDIPKKNRISEVVIDTACPYCGTSPLVVRSFPLEIPYFGDAVQMSVLCRHCSYRRSDLILQKEGPPARYELRVDGGDLTARIARSSSGTVRIPELGVAIEPGPRAESFVTNAEGVLLRIQDILEFTRRNADGPAGGEKAERLIARVLAMREGREPFTLVVEDPEGNSAIVHPRATRRVLTPEEARRLRGGPPVFRIRP